MDTTYTNFHDLNGHVIRDIAFRGVGGTASRMEITTGTHRFTFVAVGDCCASAYMLRPHADDIASVLGQHVHEAVESQVNVIHESEDYVSECIFYSIRTHGGDLDIELRVEHNGFYGGMLECTSCVEL